MPAALPGSERMSFDAGVVRSVVLAVWLVVVLVAPMFGRYAIAVAILGGAAIVWSERKRWIRRRTSREHLERWADTLVHVQGPLVVQEDMAGRRLGAIDTRDHYSVRWEYFDEERAVYYVTKGAAMIYISTLDPNARDVLVNALHVANYPCLEWPNLDL